MNFTKSVSHIIIHYVHIKWRMILISNHIQNCDLFVAIHICDLWLKIKWRYLSYTKSNSHKMDHQTRGYGAGHTDNVNPVNCLFIILILGHMNETKQIFWFNLCFIQNRMFNTLLLSCILWWHRSGLTLAQVIAWCHLLRDYIFEITTTSSRDPWIDFNIPYSLFHATYKFISKPKLCLACINEWTQYQNSFHLHSHQASPTIYQ